MQENTERVPSGDTKIGLKLLYTFGGEGYVHYLDDSDGFTEY